MTAGRQSVSSTKHWGTPPEIINSVRKVFGGSIALDPCSNSHSLVNAEVEYILPENDGLVDSWDYPTIYVNPPYGRDANRKTTILQWFEKIHEAADNGSQVIVLVPVATNTRHWKNHVFHTATAICFLAQPRVKFYIDGVEDPKGAPMACAVIYYGNNFPSFDKFFTPHGAVVPIPNQPTSESSI